MLARETVRDLIDSTVRERLAGTRINDVRVVEGKDDEGDDVIFVTVIYDQKGGLDASKTATIVRHIRHKISDPTIGFPIITYVSKSDAASLKPAFA